MAWRHPLVHSVLMSAPLAQAAQKPIHHQAACFDLGRAYREHEALPAHQVGRDDAYSGQGTPAPGTVETDGDGVLVFHDATIASSQGMTI